MLYQTGYLTLMDYSREDDIYTLGFPNNEVRYGFLESLMPEYIEECGAGSGKDIFTLKTYVENGNLDEIRNVLISLFSSITYTAKEAPFEHYFQTVIYLVFTLLSKYANCEQYTSEGRIDCIVEARKFVYLFEFKRDGSAGEALDQINKKHYADRYAADKRKLFKIGVNFSSQTRGLEGWEVEE